MKNLSVVLCAFLMSATLFAQDSYSLMPRVELPEEDAPSATSTATTKGSEPTFVYHSMNPSIGVQVGPSVSNTAIKSSSGDQTIDTTSRTGLSGGVLVELPVSGFFSIQPELNYIPRGFQMSDSVFDANFSFNMNYIELPLLLKGNLRGKSTVLSFLAGPSVSYLVSNSYELTVNDSLLGTSHESGSLNSKNFNTLNFGVDFGLSMGVNVSDAVMMTVGGRFYLSMTDALKDEGSSGISSKNNGFQVLLGTQVQL